MPRRSWWMQEVARAARPPCGSQAQPWRPITTGACLLSVAFALTMAAAAACGTTHGGSRPSSSTSSGYVASCGTARTAAHVPVRVEVARGHVACGTAQAVELAYANAIRLGHAPGNGGGGPVKVNGWTCRGFATPVVIQTGKASKCTHDSDEILEILLPLPSPSAS